MPRRSRKQIESNIYHIMLRGNERKNIFSDEEDKQRIIDTILKVKKDGEFSLYAFCVMDNHLHIVLKEGSSTLARTLKQIGTSYAYYYNHKHKRVGHVFQDRFKSEGIRDDGQWLEVIRYIHNNPVKAGIVERAADYPWSSYRYYTGLIQGKENAPLGDDISDVLNIFSSDRKKAIRLFFNVYEGTNPGEISG